MNHRLAMLALAAVAVAAASPAVAQAPQSVPLRDKAPDGGTSTGRTTNGDGPPPATGSAETVRGARNVPNGQVAPPAAINSGVQVIAPEKK